jgi:hypothetical protein
MKTKLLITLVSMFTLSAFGAGESAKRCMSEAMYRSQNFKIQNLALNVSVDDNVTFSCKNLTRLDIKELQVIRADQQKVVEQTYSKVKKGQTVNSLEFARLGAELGNRNVAPKEMCSLIESNYQSQISRSMANTFPKELKRCPTSQEEIRTQYQQIISSAYYSKLPVQDACNVLVKKLQALKDTYSSHCGVANVRPRNRLGLFAVRAPANKK